jgi:hypothetical protein
VSILIATVGAVGRYRGVRPRSKVSTMIMRPPQQRQGMTLKSVIARAEALKSLLAEAQKYGERQFKDGRAKWPSYQSDIRRFALDLRKDRQELVLLPVTNVPGLILAAYLEMYANEVAEYPEGNEAIPQAGHRAA